MKEGYEVLEEAIAGTVPEDLTIDVPMELNKALGQVSKMSKRSPEALSKDMPHIQGYQRKVRLYFSRSGTRPHINLISEDGALFHYVIYLDDGEVEDFARSVEKARSQISNTMKGDEGFNWSR